MELTAPGAKKGKGGNARRSARSTKAPWPTSLAERVATTERALKSTHAPVTAAELTKTFTRAKTEDLAETLATLGRAHRDGEKYSA